MVDIFAVEDSFDFEAKASFPAHETCTGFVQEEGAFTKLKLQLKDGAVHRNWFAKDLALRLKF